MLPWFRKWRRPAVFDSTPLPDQNFAVIGDIHGSASLLQSLLADLETATDGPVICVGDYIDRGENSIGVIDILMQRQASDGGRTICLMGNHEAMLLEALDNPETAGPRWMRHGGRETLASLGLPPPDPDADWTGLRDRLDRALGPARQAWLRALPLSWQSGNVAVVHAAADPALPMAAQTASTLLWGHRDFLRRPRQDGLWIVHGHSIVATASAEHGRIAIDTGAYATGRLSTALIGSGSIQFLST